SIFEEARDMSAEVGTNRGVALQDYFIGWALIEKGEYEHARAPLGRSLVRMRRAKDQTFVGRLLLRLGQAERRSGLVDQAEVTLGEGLKGPVPREMRIEVAEVHDERAEVAQVRGDRAAAERDREYAQSIYRPLGPPRAGEATVIGPASIVDP